MFHVISHFWLKQTRIPDERYRQPCTEFLRNGMRLSEFGIESVLKATKLKPDDVNLAEVQSAVTSAELVAGLCVRAMQGIRNTNVNLAETNAVVSA